MLNKKLMMRPSTEDIDQFIALGLIERIPNRVPEAVRYVMYREQIEGLMETHAYKTVVVVASSGIPSATSSSAPST